MSTLLLRLEDVADEIGVTDIPLASMASQLYETQARRSFATRCPRRCSASIRRRVGPPASPCGWPGCRRDLKAADNEIRDAGREAELLGAGRTETENGEMGVIVLVAGSVAADAAAGGDDLANVPSAADEGESGRDVVEAKVVIGWMGETWPASVRSKISSKSVRTCQKRPKLSLPAYSSRASEMSLV